MMNVIAYKQSYTVTLLKQIQTQRILVFGISRVLQNSCEQGETPSLSNKLFATRRDKITPSRADKPELVKDECQDQHDNSKDQASPA